MAASIGRRDFLRGRSKRPPVIRPPEAVKESTFLALCTKDCRACADACPEEIIFVDADGAPQLNFADEGCTFCNACTDACPTGALSRAEPRAWNWVADIGAGCLSFNGITCRACVDSCDPRAITFKFLGGGRDVPLLDPEACTGCGRCKAVCPANAITMIEPAKGKST